MKITVYSSPNCPYCDQLKDHLKAKEVKFEAVDLSKSPDRAQEVVEKTGQMGVPVTVINNGEEKVIVGFNPAEIDEAVK